MKSIPTSRRTTRRMSARRSWAVLFAADTSKQPQSIAFVRARFSEIATMKTRRRAPTSAADVRVQMPRMRARPARSSNQGITSARTFTKVPGTIR